MLTKPGDPAGRRFDENYFGVVEDAIEKGEVIIPAENLGHAKNLRSYLYHFRKFLKETSHPLAEEAGNLKFYVEPKALRVTRRAPGAEAFQRRQTDD